MAIQCPKCDSDNVQSVKAILEGGTTRSTGHYSGYVAGAGTSGTVGGGYASGTTYNTSRTDLASRFSPPEEPLALWKVIIMGLFIIPLGLIGFLLGADAFSGHYPQYGYMGYLFGFFMLLLFSWAVFTRVKMKKKYQEFYPGWKKMYEHGYYCHRCAATFPVK